MYSTIHIYIVYVVHGARDWLLTRERLPHVLIHSLNLVDISQPASQPAIYRCYQLYIVIIVLECGICFHAQRESSSHICTYDTFVCICVCLSVCVHAHNLFAYANRCANMIHIHSVSNTRDSISCAFQFYLNCLPHLPFARSTHPKHSASKFM